MQICVHSMYESKPPNEMTAKFCVDATSPSICKQRFYWSKYYNITISKL